MSILYAYAAPIEGDPIAERLGSTLRVGMGKVRSAVSLQAFCNGRQPPLAVLLFGLGGAYPQASPQLDVDQLCVVTHDMLVDDGVETEQGFLDLGLHEPVSMCPQRSQRVAERLGGLPLVRGATVSTCSGTDRLSDANHSRSQASVESMEGAAIALVCRSLGVPLVQLRCISNRTGDRRQSGWQLESSITTLQAAMLTLHAAGGCD